MDAGQHLVVQLRPQGCRHHGVGGQPAHFGEHFATWLLPGLRVGQDQFVEAVPLLIDECDERVEVHDPVVGHDHVDGVAQLGIVESGHLFEQGVANANGPLAGIGAGQQLVLSGEHRRQPRLEGVAAQDAEAERVDRAHRHVLDVDHQFAWQLGPELVHQIACSTLGEGDRDDATRIDPGVEGVLEPPDERLGLAGPRARRHDERPIDRRDRLVARRLVGQGRGGIRHRGEQVELGGAHASGCSSWSVSSFASSSSSPLHSMSRWLTSSLPSPSGAQAAQPKLPTSPGRNRPASIP